LIKQVILARTRFPDGRGGVFGARLGKISSQVAHASMKVFFDRAMRGHAGAYVKMEPDSASAPDTIIDCGRNTLVIPLAKDMAEWVNGSFTKVVLGVETEDDLLLGHKLALEAGLPVALIQDAGATEFKAPCRACEGVGRQTVAECEACNGTGKVNVPTYTTCAIGPAEASAIDAITGPEGPLKGKVRLL